MSSTSTPLVSISSDGTTSPGQSHRSSNDFKFTVPDGAIDLQWVVSNSVNESTVTYDVMKDISLGSDSTVASGVSNDNGYTSTSAFTGGGSFYIANPTRNPGDPAPAFTVSVYAVFPS